MAVVAGDGEIGSVAPKRRLTIQIANEKRMIAATIELLRAHEVDNITSRMIADASGTATNYISRYFGGRDGLLAAVADELGLRISVLVRGGESIMQFDQPGNQLNRITSNPEVALWFKVYRYLTGRNVPASTMPSGKPPIVTAVEEAISLIFGLEGRYLPVCANLFLTYTMGNAAFGPFLGTTDDEAEETLRTMYEVVHLLMRRGDEFATG
ncbi:MAG TPA: helix-turn-helix domain-containing protein [Acidimicrobiales bacterium]